MAKVYKHDVGTVFLVNTTVDLTLATTHNLIVYKPDGTTATWTGTDTATTKITYTTTTTGSGGSQTWDLDQAGVWSLQAYVVLPSGTWYGETVQFTVFDVGN